MKIGISIAIFTLVGLLKAFGWQDPPEIIDRVEHGYLWISAEALTYNAERVLWKNGNMDLFNGDLEEVRAGKINRSIQDFARRSKKTDSGESVCTKIHMIDYHPFPPINFTEVLQKAKGILEVRIENLTPGYYRYSPGALLSLNVETRLKEPEFDIPDHFFLYYANANFKVADVPICTENRDYFFPAMPGLRLLIFARNPAGDINETLFHENPFYIFAETSDGGFLLTDDLKGSPKLHGVTTFEELKIRTLELVGSERYLVRPEKERSK